MVLHLSASGNYSYFFPSTSRKLPQKTHITLQLLTSRTEVNMAKKRWRKIKTSFLPALALLLQLSSPAISCWFVLIRCLLLHQGLCFLLSNPILERAACKRNTLVFGSLKASGTWSPVSFNLLLWGYIRVEELQLKFPNRSHWCLHTGSQNWGIKIYSFILALITKYFRIMGVCDNCFFHLSSEASTMFLHL